MTGPCPPSGHAEGSAAEPTSQAVGNKELAEYLEVKGYADAADWVYNQALRPSITDGAETLSLTELRHIHQIAMGPVWDVAPHPNATPKEGPGSYREHDIQPFPDGMTRCR